MRTSAQIKNPNPDGTDHMNEQFSSTMANISGGKPTATQLFILIGMTQTLKQIRCNTGKLSGKDGEEVRERSQQVIERLASLQPARINQADWFIASEQLKAVWTLLHYRK